MKIVKFGGKSLASGQAFDNVINIIKKKVNEGPITIVVSAIGDTTDTLENILDLAKTKQDYTTAFEAFKNRAYHNEADIHTEIEVLSKLYEGVSLIEDYGLKIKDQVLAQGELISSKILAAQLNAKGIKAIAVDSRQFFITDNNFGSAQALDEVSKKKTQAYFATLDKGTIAVVTGFIGATEKGETTTLGRNGSNYSAALLANFIQADELQNYTHVDGIYTANPDWVKNAQKIEELHFDEANELANFGASILHAKTILPLVENNIPLRILNTLNPDNKGTLISNKTTAKGIKSLSVQSNVALIQFEGRGLLGIVGVDARVFTALANEGISVGVISQGSSERGLGFIVEEKDADKAAEALNREFSNDFYTRDVNSISIIRDIAVISIIGQNLSTFDKPYAALVKNKIVPILFNNTVTGKNVSLVVRKEEAKKALNVIHGQIFGIAKKINIAVFGHGLVGGTLIDQILHSAQSIEGKKNIALNIFAIGNSKKVLLNDGGINCNWREDLKEKSVAYNIQEVIDYANANHLENLIAIDNTASGEFIKNYIPLVENGFDLISSNKIANTISYSFYKELRQTLKANHKEYLYETNVGAGLPLIDTIKLLHLSGENITKIKGVFSGSLSYIFNNYSIQDRPFSEVLKEAIEKGYTEPDPREDLSGNDVGRKLLILARELDLQNEFEEINIQNLIPTDLQAVDTPTFLNSLEKLNPYFDKIKQGLAPDTVLRYVGELSGDLQEDKGVLETKLIEVPTGSALGQLKGSDSIFEIYTESYGDNPIIIQGAGAGASVTARGVFGDILRLADK
ncbi:bifunctional aspartate kinase/homoserine dehydrogenase I [Myroides odoratimimus]|uniref:bifunctional aspartate kinase/homoserine dehydrogenase I n=1 Tax=Myroides odoratimimus TaxID=76832 RepID=UPI0024C09B81|nr:bifunctional aspartate kinase/homoserine dehydrogenase I [Myroides odoratimimus]WHT74746.1 bifunctional aspartate kinase/homoserine dehydrogenase I [Myroides odoratimimus]WHU39329.1 bifunctional aspartate kinase/homoserine dehydrogenase I [Myroides odoratimimus]